MEDEIDLRVYIEVLFRYWIWIVGLALAAAIVAFAVSSFLPHTYEATSVVIVTQPRYQIQFDPRFDTLEETPAYRAFPTLATSDGILQAVIENYTPSGAGGIDPWALSTLRRMVEASSEGDPSLVVLKVTSQSPEDAAGIANAWAEALARRGDELYGQSEADVVFFEAMAQQAQQSLDQAEAALVEFQARNQSSILNTQLNSLLQAQADYLADQRTVENVIQDIQGLRAQLEGQTASQNVSLADDLTALLLQIKAFNAQATTPVQLQVDGSAGFSDKSMTEQRSFLESLSKTLQAKSVEIDGKLAELEPQILAAQRDLQAATVESDQLTRTRDLARDTYTTLANKEEEARIAAQEASGMLQVGSEAVIPTKPVGPRRLLNTVVACVLGALVGVVSTFGIEFWRRGKATVQSAKE